MCTRYISPEEREIEAAWHIGAHNSERWVKDVHPAYMAPIIRRPPERDSGDEAVPDLEVVVGHFGLLPPFAENVKYIARYGTYNARTETVAKLRSFKPSWEKAWHCIVPCAAIYEPDWRTNEHVPTRFTAANDDMLGVAGIWAPWKNPATLEVELSFAMLTLNADDHPMFKLMHKPDLKRPPNEQDKRMVVILPAGLHEAWLDAPVERSFDFVRQYPAELLRMTPEPIERPQMNLF